MNPFFRSLHLDQVFTAYVTPTQSLHNRRDRISKRVDKAVREAITKFIKNQPLFTLIFVPKPARDASWGEKISATDETGITWAPYPTRGSGNKHP